MRSKLEPDHPIFAAFTHRDLPAQQWLSARSRGVPECNRVPSARSFLSRGWKEGQNARPVTLPSVRSKTYAGKTKPTDLPGFTEFITQEQAQIRAGAKAIEEQPRDTESSGERNDANAGNAAHTSHLTGLGSVEFVRLQDVVDLARTSSIGVNVTSDKAIELHRQRFQNLQGPIPDDAEDIALVAVELLGVDSKAGKCCCCW